MSKGDSIGRGTRRGRGRGGGGGMCDENIRGSRGLDLGGGDGARPELGKEKNMKPRRKEPIKKFLTRRGTGGKKIVRMAEVSMSTGTVKREKKKGDLVWGREREAREQ